VSSAASGETTLGLLLRSMAPELDPERYVFVTHTAGLPSGVRPIVTVVEAEGHTAVVAAERLAEVLAAGARCDDPTPWARITLTVHSALSAVGLTAAVSGALAQLGISCNVVAGYHHDHLFVPGEVAPEALAALVELSERS
jgi:hypothetical protein